MGTDLNPEETPDIDINDDLPPSPPPPPKKKKTKKRAKRRAKPKTFPKTKKALVPTKPEELTAGDQKQFRKGKLTAAEIRSHSTFNDEGRREYTVKLKTRDADWLEAYAAMTGGDSQTLLEYLVKSGRNEDPTKGGTVGFEFKEGETLRSDEAGGGRTFKKGSTFLPPVR